MPREFTASKAVRHKVPMLLGLYGPSGSGKSLSALRLARGIQRVQPGPIVVADSEAKRALHYAPKPGEAPDNVTTFAFEHVPFEPPYSPEDYAQMLRYCVSLKPSVVIVDSGSHLHEGPGGMLEMHADELKRMGGSDKHNFTAWIKPKRQLVALVGELLRMERNFIWCFRAKEKLKIVPGKNPVALGWQPIMPDELPYEMVINALLEPGAAGVPQWKPSQPGEQVMVKLPGHFRRLLSSGQPFNEDMGQALAMWAAGDSAQPTAAPRFARNYPQWGGKLLSEAPMATVLEYISALETKEQSPAITSALADAQKFYDNEVAAEFERSQKGAP